MRLLRDGKQRRRRRRRRRRRFGMEVERGEGGVRDERGVVMGMKMLIEGGGGGGGGEKD